MKIIDKNTSLQGLDFQNEIGILVNKPSGWTSFDVVNKIRFCLRQLYGTKKFKVGHTGTLDPMATGLLIICCGKGTKKAGEFQKADKRYEGEIQFGGKTESYDKETDVIEGFPTAHLNLKSIQAVLPKFTGDIQQVPPLFSALKKNGIPMYKLARKGVAIQIEPRTVRVYDFKVDEFENNRVSFRIHCGKGTYIRSIAHDMGIALSTGAYLYSLNRTSIGPYEIENAWSLQALVQSLKDLQSEIRQQ